MTLQPRTDTEPEADLEGGWARIAVGLAWHYVVPFSTPHAEGQRTLCGRPWYGRQSLRPDYPTPYPLDDCKTCRRLHGLEPA